MFAAHALTLMDLLRMRSPLTAVRPAIDVEHLAGHRLGLRQVQYRVSDFIH